MNIIQKQFLELLRSGLWDKDPDTNLFTSGTDWNKIYEESQRQALLGVVLDGIIKLPLNLRPDKSLYLKWCADVINLEDANQKLNKEVVNLFKYLHENGVQPILLKGQGLAELYPNPLHRSSGDIDIYIGKRNYDKVNQLLSYEGTSNDIWSTHHMAYHWHNVTVENHRLIGHLLSPFSQRNLEKLVDKWMDAINCDYVTINDTEIAIPPVDFNVVYILLHSIIHMLGSGIGLRQSCDWAIFLNKKNKEINWNNVKNILKDLGIFNGWKIFGVMAVNYLGLPKKDLFTEFDDKDEREAEKLIEDIFHKGNFGFFDNKKRNKKNNFLKQRWENYKSSNNRKRSLRKIAPGEAKWAPLMIVGYFISSRLFYLKRKK